MSSSDVLIERAVEAAKKQDVPIVIRDEDVPEPLNWQIIIEPWEARRTVGNIFIAEAAREAEQWQINMGVIRKIGPLALCGKTQSGLDLAVDKSRIKPGEVVVFHRYTGLKMKVEVEGGERQFIALSTEDLVCIPPNPNAIRFWI